jgi:H+/Cl- antiporter ClcA
VIFSSSRLRRVQRFDQVEPFVMLATVVQWLVLATITGAIAGSGTSLFLKALFYLAGRTASEPLWMQMALLPAGGLINGLLLHYGYRANSTGLKDTVFAAVHEQEGRMPLRTLFIKPVAALVTLACGGSAGKEGPCAHIGASLGAAIGRVLHLNSELSKRIVACGVSAGFASVFGTPIAGAIYGVEVLAVGRIRYDFLFPAIIAGITSFQISKFWGIPYEYYSFSRLPSYSELLFFKTVMIGIVCGGVALLFVEAVHRSKAAFAYVRSRFGIWPPLMPLLGGGILALLVLVVPYDYYGLSLPIMDQALHGQPMSYMGFLWKTLLVAVTLGSGFYGGVVTPQFVIGAVTGGAFAHLFGIDPSLGAAIGLVAVVASASNTPIAAILMGVELFGGGVGTLFAAGAAIAAYLVIGHRSIYPDQQIAFAKSSLMRIRPDTVVSADKARLSYGLLRWWRRRR